MAVDGPLIVSGCILLAVVIVVSVGLFIYWRKGIIEKNPFLLLWKKEWSVFYHAVFKWKGKRESVGRYPFHKGSNYFWLFIALLHEQLIEGVVFHIYLKETDPIRANILLVLHFYSILYMLGDYRLVRHSPLRLDGNKVIMKVGVRRSLVMDIGDISTIQPARIQYDSRGSMIHEKGVFHVCMLPRVFTRVFGMVDELKYEIILKEPVDSLGYFGQKKPVGKVFIYMDDPEPFISHLKKKCKRYEECGVVEAAASGAK
jgi:hypothetical protein